MKKYFIYLPVTILVLLMAASCQKVIQVDLNSARPNLIVEAALSDNSADTVRLTQTVNFSSSNVQSVLI